jgi:hypothetical protein
LLDFFPANRPAYELTKRVEQDREISGHSPPRYT